MRRLFYLLPLFCFLCFPSCQDTKTASGELTADASFDEEAELEAIMKVIENETACFFARDYDCWKENWVDEDYAFQAWNNQDGTYDAKVGWSEVDRRVGNYIKENTSTLGGTQGHPKVNRLNLRKRFYGNQVAHLTWEQYNSDEKEETYQISQEVRLMEKVDGHWKIVTVAAFWDYVNKVQASTVDSM
ncbi:hypothetical protein [Neolewinella persica]|uniref:hypothetical protein n=1 Tax=Neolewinella persica TaxID=70998 RepID=UPI00035F3C07|nr:hypothetical protein [Neolewinella persica]